MILVYGASGFVGGALLPILASAGHTSILAVDRSPIGKTVLALARSNGARVAVRRLDHLPPESRYLNAAVCLAGATSVDAALDAPESAYADNLTIAIAFGAYLRRNPTIRGVYVSSDEVLGPTEQPLPPSAPLKPTQPYAASKAAAETVLHNYRDVYDLNLVTLRSCNLVGPRQRKPKLLPVAVDSLIGRSSVPVHGDGEQRREFMHVDDFCSAVIDVIDPAVPCGIYQATTEESLSVNQVVELAAEATQLPLSTINVADRVVQDRSYAMDSSSLRAVGWMPSLTAKSAITAAAKALSMDRVR